MSGSMAARPTSTKPAWLIELNASMRFTSDWQMAITAPTDSDANASATMIGDQAVPCWKTATYSTRASAAKPAALAIDAR